MTKCAKCRAALRTPAPQQTGLGGKDGAGPAKQRWSHKWLLWCAIGSAVLGMVYSYVEIGIHPEMDAGFAAGRLMAQTTIWGLTGAVIGFLMDRAF